MGGNNDNRFTMDGRDLKMTTIGLQGPIRGLLMTNMRTSRTKLGSVGTNMEPIGTKMGL